MTEDSEGVAMAGGEVSGELGGREVDVFLRVLANYCNEQGAGLSLTVHSGGTIVTGTLISDTEYYNLLAETVRIALPGDESAEAFAGGVEYWARLATGSAGEEEGPSGGAETAARRRWRTRHLHMRPCPSALLWNNCHPHKGFCGEGVWAVSTGGCWVHSSRSRRHRRPLTRGPAATDQCVLPMSNGLPIPQSLHYPE